MTTSSPGRSQLMKFTLLSKNVLSIEEAELYELTQLTGTVLDPSVFKIILDLLKLNVAPTAVLQMLKSMSGQRRKKGAAQDPVPPSRSDDINTRHLPIKGRLPATKSRSDYR